MGTGRACGWNILHFGSPQFLLRESSSPSYGAVRAGTDELGEWGSHKSVPSSFLVQSKPQQRRQSGHCSFDILEGLHPNLLVKEVLLLFPGPYATLLIIQHHACFETPPLVTHPNTSFAHSFVQHSRWAKTATWESNTMHDKGKLWLKNK